MSIFQKVANWIKAWAFPAWLKPFIQDLNDTMILIAKKAGEAYVQYLKDKIIEAAGDLSLTPSQKFQYVWSAAKGSAVPFIVSLKDSELNTLINYLVSMLKKKEVI